MKDLLCFEFFIFEFYSFFFLLSFPLDFFSLLSLFVCSSLSLIAGGSFKIYFVNLRFAIKMHIVSPHKILDL